MTRGTTSPTTSPRSRAYRWGEDGIAGISDDKQRLCFALALWNEHDPILKERLFGLTNSEGNHGEDVKEYYFYVDNVPTHAYQRYLYKYPQAAFPYEELVRVNAGAIAPRTGVRTDRHRRVRRRPLLRRRGRVRQGGSRRHPACSSPCTTAARSTRRSICCPTLWFRNRWSWPPNEVRPAMSAVDGPAGDRSSVRVEHPTLGEWHLDVAPGAELLFCENESNARAVVG